MTAVLGECVEHNQKGKYARTKRDGKLIQMHAAALWDATGEAPNGRMTLHHCDNHRCINPAHLYYGDHAQNMRDRAERKRAQPGLPRKLEDSMVCRARTTNESIDKLAEEFNVTRTAVWNARMFLTYQSTECPKPKF